MNSYNRINVKEGIERTEYSNCEVLAWDIDQDCDSFCFKTRWSVAAHKLWVSIKNVSRNLKKIGSLSSKKWMCHILGFKLVLQVWGKGKGKQAGGYGLIFFESSVSFGKRDIIIKIAWQS